VRFKSIVIVLFITACSANPQPPLEVKTETCDIEYTQYQATVTGYCQEAEASLPTEIPTIEKEIALRSVASIPDVFWYSTKMKYSLVKQEEKAPLAFVIAGTGASYNSAKMISLQKTLYQQGYHVISLSSPTYSNFIINLDSSTDFPGVLEQDAKNLYRIMKKVHQQVITEDNVVATTFSLTGYSLGGAHSAYVAQLDESEQFFNFEKVVLINPPVSLYNSVNILDSYLDLKEGGPDAASTILDDIFLRFADSYAEQESSSFSQSAIYALFRDANLSEEELKLLIGASFRMSSTDMLFALDVSYNVGGIIYKNHKINKFESITHSMYRASVITFKEYFEKVLVPWQQESDASLTREALIARLSLKNIENYLRHSDKISLVTNADDIILAEGEVEYLQDVFGLRAKIFPRGGHCGNIDRVSFVEYLNSQFQGVKQ
jgi:hypothetical protein